jgi:hypothetical protein
MPTRRLLVACAFAGWLLALASAPAAAAECGGCRTFHGLGYVAYYVYYPRTNYYQPRCGGFCYHRSACARAYDPGRTWGSWLPW